LRTNSERRLQDQGCKACSSKIGHAFHSQLENNVLKSGRNGAMEQMYIGISGVLCSSIVRPRSAVLLVKRGHAINRFKKMENGAFLWFDVAAPAAAGAHGNL
jgi:hypothetical protein